MKETVFAITMAAEILIGVSLTLTLLLPNFRVWPPHGRHSWQYLFTWGLTIMSFLGIIVLVIMDWNSFIYRHWSRFVIAIPMIIAGNALAFWGLRTLSLHSTLGLGGELITEGTYRITRNPQYVGDMTVLIGYALMSNSRLTMVSALVGCLCFLLTPFMEEPWLREQFGEEYDEYAQEVPRFLSVRGLRRLWEG